MDDISYLAYSDSAYLSSDDQKESITSGGATMATNRTNKRRRESSELLNTFRERFREED